MEQTDCIICGSSKSDSFLHIRDRLDQDSGLFRLVQCECGFIYLNPRPGTAEISAYYTSTDYDPHKSDKKSIQDILYRWVQNWALGWKYRKIRSWHTSGNLADIGGGQGEFCSYFRDRGWRVTLQDTSPTALYTAAERGLDTVETLDDLRSRGPFQVITMWHALEHIHHVDRLFHVIDDILAPDGILVLAVPNHNAPERPYFKESWAPYEAPRHLYHFTQRTLTDLLEKYGYESIQEFGLLQDTPYNILLSLPDHSIKSIFRGLGVLLNSIYKSKRHGAASHSSIGLICKKLTNS